MIKRLAHLCFKSDRVAEMIGFYRDIMGFPVQFTMKDAEGRDFGWYFALGNRSFLEIFDQAGAARKWGGEVKPIENKPGGPYQHFCLEVEGIEAERQRLIAAGVSVGEIKTGMDGSLQCWIADPDGNRIELMEYTPASRQLQ